MFEIGMRSPAGRNLLLKMVRLSNLQEAPIGVLDEAYTMFSDVVLVAEKHPTGSADIFITAPSISHRKS